MSQPARWVVLITALLLSFGLAELYSASAFVVVDNAWLDSTVGAFDLRKQAMFVGVGALVFLIAAKVDAARLEKFAWHFMLLAIATMTAVLIFGTRHYGSKRFLVGNAVQPSEFAKLAVIIWVSMLIVKKGETLRRLTKGLLPFLVIIGLLDILAILEPDLSIALLFTLVTAMLLYVGGARLAHFIFLAALLVPVAMLKAGGF